MDVVADARSSVSLSLLKKIFHRNYFNLVFQAVIDKVVQQ
jgi:hypothetical protein